MVNFMHEIDLSKYIIRTDLIVEHLNNFKEYKKNVALYKDIKIETVTLDKESAKLISKKEGIYKTIYFEDVTDEANFNNLLYRLIIMKIEVFSEKETTSCTCLLFQILFF